MLSIGSGVLRFIDNVGVELFPYSSQELLKITATCPATSAFLLRINLHFRLPSKTFSLAMRNNHFAFNGSSLVGCDGASPPRFKMDCM